MKEDLHEVDVVRASGAAAGGGSYFEAFVVDNFPSSSRQC